MKYILEGNSLITEDISYLSHINILINKNSYLNITIDKNSLITILLNRDSTVIENGS